MNKVILYFGSFNPVHRGHLAVASKALSVVGAHELWFVVSPQNPFKSARDIAPEGQRLRMVEMAIHESGNDDSMRASDVEFDMPRPSRTVDTLELLRKSHPQTSFSLLMGSDNAVALDKWKNYEQLIQSTDIYVYPREGYDYSFKEFAPRLKSIDGVELLDFMATDVREMIAEAAPQEQITKIITRQVYDFITENKIYQPMTIEELSTRIAEATTPTHAIPLLMERARLYMKSQRHGDALNDYNAVLAIEPTNTQARQGAIMVRDILEFRYTDIYNP